MNLIKRVVQLSAVVTLLAGLAACGGSDTSNASPGESATFTISLAAVDVHRVSNDADVSVDTTDIESGELTLRQ